MTSPVLLRVEGLRLTLADDVALVHQLDFELRAGETLAIVGESGCGKSLTALSLMGLLPSGIKRARGRVLFQGEDLCTWPEPRYRDLRGHRMSMIFQEPMTSLNPVLTIGEQLKEVLQRHLKLNAGDALAQARDLLAMVQIADPGARLRSYAHQLSGGQRQRVMIAMALACPTQLLIADEPTTALDVTVQSDILALLSEQKRQRQLAMLLVTHDFGVVAQVADRVLVMYAGQKIEEGPARQVLTDPRHPYTQRLLRARPSARQDRHQRLAEIPGLVPAPQDYRGGCPFASRCDQVLPACRLRVPDFSDHGQGHRSACVMHDAR
jgi:peptide/nickel transport system ATP-binding protein